MSNWKIYIGQLITISDLEYVFIIIKIRNKIAITKVTSKMFYILNLLKFYLIQVYQKSKLVTTPFNKILIFYHGLDKTIFLLNNTTLSNNLKLLKKKCIYHEQVNALFNTLFS